MKIRLLISILCGFLVVILLSGCGQKAADASPSAEVSSSPDGSLSKTTMVTGIVGSIDNGLIALNLVIREDAPPVGTARTLSVDETMYVTSDETSFIKADGKTIVVLEYQGYTSGSLSVITEGDFLAVVLRDDTALVIIDRGPAEAYFTGEETGGPGATPGDGSNQPAASPSKGVPDSSEKTTYTITTDSLKVRSGPGTSYSVLGILDKGARAIGTVSGGWLEFTYDGSTGYCSAEFLAVSTAPEGVPDSNETKTYKTADTVMIRSGPGTTYASLGTLQKGTEVTGTVANGWLKFTYEDKLAYCSASYLTKG